MKRRSHHLARGERVAGIAVLLDAGASPETQDEFGRTLLHWAAGEGGPENVAAFLDAGANIEARDHRGMTPLHLAADSCRAPVVIAVLLDAGADPKALDERTWTPWDWARGRSELDGAEAYRRLRNAHTRQSRESP